jgi:hypothetical protein
VENAEGEHGCEGDSGALHVVTVELVFGWVSVDEEYR